MSHDHEGHTHHHPESGVDGDVRLTVIIPSWNQRDLLLECLESLAQQTYANFDIMVVDDGSTDDTVTAVNGAYPNVHVISMDENAGFAAAVNTGIQEIHTEFVLLLNNDMTLDKHCLAELVEAADRSEAAMFAPLVLWKDDPAVVYSAGDRILANGRPQAIGFRVPLDEFAPPDRIFGVSAGAALYRRMLFDEIGYFDESYIAYFEDADLCARARLAGLDAAFVGDAVAYHVGSASIRGRMWWRTRQCSRNYFLLIAKTFPVSVLLRHSPEIAVESLQALVRIVDAARCEFGLGKAIGILFTALYSLGRQLPNAVQERMKIQRHRAITPLQFNDLLTRAPRK